MGLFDGLFAAADILKGGIAAFKATEKLEELATTSMDDYDDVLTDESRKLYQTYVDLHAKQEDTEDIDEQNAMTDDVEGALVAYLVSLGANSSLPRSFRNEVQGAIVEYQKANDLSFDLLEKRFMKMAKTDEERDFVRQCMEEAKKDES